MNDHVIFLKEYKNFIEATFPSTRGIYYNVHENGKVVGVFPFFHIKQTGLRSLVKGFDIFADKVVSAAFYDYGGWSGKVQDPLKIVEDVKRRTGVSSVEVRGGELDLPCRVYKRFVLKLVDKETVWNGIQKEKRKAIRKAEKSGVTVRLVQPHELKSLYILYLKNARVFGELPLPRKYFENFFVYIVKKKLGRIYGGYVDGMMVSALLGFTVGKRIHIKLALSLPEYLQYRVNDAVHWRFIEYGLENGFTMFDFGRTREDSGQFQYKKKWGGELMDLKYYYLGEMPDIDPTNVKYKFFIWCQQHMPLWFGAFISSQFREGLGI